MRLFIQTVLILTLFFDFGYMQEPKNMIEMRATHPEIKYDQRWQGIEKFPRAVREWDSLRVEIYKFRSEIHQKDSSIVAREVDMPMDLLLSAARAYISSRIFYWNLKYNAPAQMYPPGGDGFLVQQIKRRLPEPWGLLAEINGIVLVEAIKDTMLQSSSSKYSKREYPENLVLYGKVVDDVLGTIEEDTIMTRHCSVWFDDLFPISKRPNLLLILRSGTNAIINGEEIQIYFCEWRPSWEHPVTGPKYMYVEDGIVHDPFSVLNIEGKKYEDFKSEMREFLKEQGIRP